MIPSFVTPTCPNSTNIGPNCNISNTACDLPKPCQNNGTCNSTSTIQYGYICLCPSGFTGIQCQLDQRLCKPNTCWNNGMYSLFFLVRIRRCFLVGTCNETSNTTFNCGCADGWEGIYCETEMNYCQNITCENNGVCRPLFMNYSCECLGESYSGRHCEIIANKMVVREIVSKSFGYIAILSLISVALFIITMDVLKYCFGIDPVGKKVGKKGKKKQVTKRKPPVILRFIYVNAPPVPSPADFED
jgi:hypothetical protein